MKFSFDARHLGFWPTTLALFVFSPWACGGDEAEPSSEEPPPIGLGGGDGDFSVASPGDGGGNGNSDVNELPPPIEVCEFNGIQTVGDANESLLIDDFDDGDGLIEGNGRWGSWYGYGDETSTQTPEGEVIEGWLPERGGLTEDGYALHAVGSGFGSWGSGQGVDPAFDAESSVLCLYDASAFDGVSFWARGSVVDETGAARFEDRGVIKFGIAEAAVVPLEEGGTCTGEAGSCWDWHKTRISLGECWRRYSFRFEDLTQDGWGATTGALDMDQMYNMSFELSQGQSYDFWVDEVSFFVGSTPEEEEICDIGAGGAGGAGN